MDGITSVKPRKRWQEIQDEFYANAELHTHLAFEPNSLYARDLVIHMADTLGINGSQGVLEIGAGAGRFTLHMGYKCKELTALDTSAPLLEALDREVPATMRVKSICAHLSCFTAKNLFVKLKTC